MNEAPPLRQGGRTNAQRVQFEIPFPIWCTTCPQPTIIGAAVRVTASKSRIGTYHNTPIYSVRFTHINCGGEIELKNSPSTSSYEIVEGARKRTAGDTKVTEEDFEILTSEEREKKKAKAFAVLEYKAQEEERDKGTGQRILGLYESSKQWEYPFESNPPPQRTGAYGVIGDGRGDLVASAPIPSRERQMEEVGHILERQKAEAKTAVKKAEVKVGMDKKAFAESVRANMRLKFDPFLSTPGAPRSLSTGSRLELGIKRKPPPEEPDLLDAMELFVERLSRNREGGRPTGQVESASPKTAGGTLVDYVSDSE